MINKIPINHCIVNMMPIGLIANIRKADDVSGKYDNTDRLDGTIIKNVFSFELTHIYSL